MKDIQTHLNKIRSDAAECLVLGTLAPDGKQAMFTRIAEHLNALATDLEKTMATRDDPNQVLTALVSSEQVERKALSERMAALAGRLDNLDGKIDNLEKTSAETAKLLLTTGSTGAEA